VRAAGPRYCVVRSTGLTSEEADTPFLLEASQGDRVSGKISRAEVADVIVAALGTPAATGRKSCCQWLVVAALLQHV